MPSHYWHICDRCQDETYRYRNAVRCQKCGGNLIRRNIPKNPDATFRRAGKLLQELPPKEISESVLDILSQLDHEHISHMVALISAWITVNYDPDKFRDLMQRVEVMKKEARNV